MTNKNKCHKLYLKVLANYLNLQKPNICKN